MSDVVTVWRYQVARSGEDLHIKILSNGKSFAATYTDELYDIMKSGVFRSAAVSGGYLKFICKCGTVYFHHIVYCSLYRNLTKDNYIQVLSDFRKELNDNDWCIDHLQGDKSNNRIYNLSFIPRKANSQKEHFERVYKDIFAMIAAFDGKGYRICFSYLKQQEHRLLYYCEGYTELCKLLKYLGKNKWAIRKEHLGKVCDDDFYLVKGKFFPRLVPKYEEHCLQKLLLEIDIEKFTKYRCKDTDLVL